MTSTSDNALLYVWVDLELSGLTTDLDDIFEFGILGTTEDLRVIYEQTIVVNPTDHGLARAYARPVVHEMMLANGLLDDLLAGRASGTLPDISTAEQMIINKIESFERHDTLILAGSGVTHCDLRFLKRHTPTLAAMFDDREIWDVGIPRRQYKRATGQNLTEANSGKNHRADVDIACSLAEGRAFFDLFHRNELVSA